MITPNQLAEIKSRLQAAMPKTEWSKDRTAMTWTPEALKYGARIWYDDGDGCAEVRGNLGLDIDGNAVAEFFANSIRDMQALFDHIDELKSQRGQA